ncbi:MAG: ubiquitin-activating E1 FCCH domain-containing protein [Candidatus Pacebacteria bacterium]|nr:ubiquitin-activating E1 FCCH domain-containing protein [Candidatus Paceibacterota bacterium]
MPKTVPLICSFNGGEISSRLDARSDLQKYLSSCRVLENFIPLVEGGAQARPGLYYVAEIKDSSKSARLFPFQFSTVKAYIVLAEDGYFRFFTNSAQIVTAPATPYEISNPYDEADLPNIKITQSADILYLAHRDYPLQKLSRTSDATWTLTDFVPATGGTLTITGASQAATCVITATGEDSDFPASGDIIYITGCGGMTEINDLFFTAALVELMPNQVDRDFSAASAWANVDLNAYNETGDLSLTADAAAQYCTCPVLSAPTTAGKRYRVTFDAANIVSTWELKSFDGTQTIGTVIARGEQSFDFLASTAGGFRLVAGAINSNGDFDNFSLTELGTFQLSGINSTTYSAYTSGGTAQKCQFGTTGNNPGAIAFFEQRFMAGGTENDPLDVYGSASADFENFIQDPADASSAVQYSLLSDKVDSVNWMIGEEYLMIGTAAGVWRLGASSASDPLTIDNVVAKRQLSTGVKDMDAEMVQDSILYVQRGGTTVRKAAWQWEKDKYVGLDVTRIAKHITKGSTRALSGIVDMDYQSEPMSILWAVRKDGILLGMVYEPEENLYPWFRVTTDGDFESVAAVTNADNEDQVWVIVKRTIGGATKRYVEYFKPHEFFNVYEDAFFVDSGLTWDGGAAKTITGITNANPPVVTATAHGFTDGDEVRITGVLGMTEVNQGLVNAYTVANKTTNTFELSGIDSSAWGSYTSGGSAQVVSKSLSGLSHLAGETVAVHTNEGKHPNIVVSSGGSISLTHYANVVTAGLPYNYNLQPMKIEPGIPEGTSRGRKKKIISLSAAFHESAGVKWGPDADHLTDVPFGTGGAPVLFTGDKETDFDGDYETDASIYIQGSSPLPCTVLSITPNMETTGG